MEKKYYGEIDGLRMIAAFGIVMMHMAGKNDYEISGYVYNIRDYPKNCVNLQAGVE